MLFKLSRYNVHKLYTCIYMYVYMYNTHIHVCTTQVQVYISDKAEQSTAHIDSSGHRHLLVIQRLHLFTECWQQTVLKGTLDIVHIIIHSSIHFTYVICTQGSDV